SSRVRSRKARWSAPPSRRGGRATPQSKSSPSNQNSPAFPSTSFKEQTMFPDPMHFGEPDATAAGFFRHLYEQFVPPPIPSPAPTRIQVDEFGRPVSPLGRHLRG